MQDYIKPWLFLLFIVSTSVLSAEGRQIVIVKSSDNTFFNQTIETLISNVDSSATFKIVETEALGSNLDLLKSSDLILTLGSRATQEIVGQYKNKTVISAYVTESQLSESNPVSKNQIWVLLDQPLSRYLLFSRYLLNLKSIGIINRTELKLSPDQQASLTRESLSLNQYRPISSDNILTTVRRLLDLNDALLMLSDQSIYNRDTLKGILLTSYRSRKPVISYSPAHVKSGAIASIYSSPENIGMQLADLLNEDPARLRSKEPVVHFAHYYSIATNTRVARALGLNLPEEAELRKQLQMVLP